MLGYPNKKAMTEMLARHNYSGWHVQATNPDGVMYLYPIQYSSEDDANHGVKKAIDLHAHEPGWHFEAIFCG